MLKSYEILGTDKPILKERETKHFFLDEISFLNENPEHYEIVAYLQVVKSEGVFFKPLFSMKG